MIRNWNSIDEYKDVSAEWQPIGMYNVRYVGYTREYATPAMM